MRERELQEGSPGGDQDISDAPLRRLVHERNPHAARLASDVVNANAASAYFHRRPCEQLPLQCKCQEFAVRAGNAVALSDLDNQTRDKTLGP